MKRFLASSAFLLAASTLSAQQPTPPAPAAAQAPAQLDAIVGVVGDEPITRYDLREKVLARIQTGTPAPTTPADSVTLDSIVLSDMMDEELLIQKAKDLKIEVEDADLSPQVDRQVKDVRSKYASETEFRNALAEASLGTPEEYRRYLMDEYRRQMTLDKTIRQLTTDGKIVPVNVTDAEIQAEYDRNKSFLQPKPPTVTFKQIVIAPQASDAAKAVAKAKAESLLVQLKSGSDFEKLAKRESMDLKSKETGGDLGWMRRNDNLPEFERWLFGTTYVPGLQPGELSPVVETPFGYHIIRVDRVQPGEVKAHQILISPVVDSNDVVRTHALADSVAKLLKNGASFDTLAKKYNDYADKEETGILTPYPRDSLPVAYQVGLKGAKAGDITVFQIPWNPSVPKFVVIQMLTAAEGGEQTLADLRTAVRTELAQRGGVHRYVEQLRKATYVSVRLSGDSSSGKGAP
ncbi:MAG TPA: peptidylprolyl isomerase [Gemmatimonadaceae bacterium]|jgi:peptidyl-prolyl cis-trans isomerase SurA